MIAVAFCERPAASLPTTEVLLAPSPHTSRYNYICYIARVTHSARSAWKRTRPYTDCFSRRPPQTRLRSIAANRQPASVTLPDPSQPPHSATPGPRFTFSHNGAVTRLQRNDVCTIAAKAMGNERRCDQCLGRSVFTLCVLSPPTRLIAAQDSTDRVAHHPRPHHQMRRPYLQSPTPSAQSRIVTRQTTRA